MRNLFNFLKTLIIISNGFQVKLIEVLDSIMTSIESNTTDISTNASSISTTNTKVNATINANGSINLASLHDAAAANSTMYFSLEANAAVYKDAAGIVNNLYTPA